MAPLPDAATCHSRSEAPERMPSLKDAMSNSTMADAQPAQQPSKQPAAVAAGMAACTGHKPVHYAPADNDCSNSLHMDAQQYLFDAGAAYDTSRPTFLLLEDEEEDEQQRQQQQEQQQRRQKAWQQRQQQEEQEQEEQQEHTMCFLDTDNAASNDSTSFLELAHCDTYCEDLGRNGSCPATTEPEAERQLYRLVLIDDATGQPLRPATEEDAQQLALLMSSSCESGADGSGVCTWPPIHVEYEAGGSGQEGEGGAGGSNDSQESAEVVSGRARAAGDGEAVAAVPAQQPLRTFHHKAGGPCDHCGVKDSPQWRRGPSAKPILCNACGTRYRRTNQLGAPIPSNGKPANRKRSGGGGGNAKRPPAGKAAKKAAGAGPRS